MKIKTVIIGLMLLSVILAYSQQAKAQTSNPYISEELLALLPKPDTSALDFLRYALASPEPMQEIESFIKGLAYSILPIPNETILSILGVLSIVMYVVLMPVVLVGSIVLAVLVAPLEIMDLMRGMPYEN